MILKNREDLLRLASSEKKKLGLRLGETEDKSMTEILICGIGGCQAKKSMALMNALNRGIRENHLDKRVSVHMVGCFGMCSEGPIVKILPHETFYVKVNPPDAEEIISRHILKGEIIDRLLYTDPATGRKTVRQDEIPFFEKQVKIALRNSGVISPESILEYIGNDGYLALSDSLCKNPQEIIEVIKNSGLRGRGGAGFPTGIKWESAARNISDEKYVICNADEGDPGAFMDRSIIEGDPHSVLEAMAVCGYAIGANKGYIYVRAEYPLAIERLMVAINQAESMGLLGKDILGSGFDFDIEIRYGAGAFVCGEGTALMHSIEGKRGEPRVKPPSSSKSGLWKKPTCLNNVETFANIPVILRNGAGWFSSISTEKSKGTKVFALGGKVVNTGLVEVPMGTTMKELIFSIGGVIPGGKKFKALQTGGPSGGCLPEVLLDTPVDYQALENAHTMMGSGGILVLSEDDCMVNISKFFLEFTVDESCGKCTPCRIGNKRLLEMLQKIVSGKASEDILDNLQDLGETIKYTSFCGLGKAAPNPVLSTLLYFREEYEEHVRDKKCGAGVCRDLLKYFITVKCIGCTKCAKLCPAEAIKGLPRMLHVISQEKCIKCGACYTGCPVKAIDME